MRNLRLDICYDGSRYRGFQRLKDSDNTIQGKLEDTLSRLLEEPIEVSGSGRTDAGVHALRQVVSFHCNSAMPCKQILEGLRRYLPEDIGIYSCQEASPRFHARLNAATKTYCYRIFTAEEPCVFQRKYVYIFREPLDLDQMRLAAQILVGEHDFSAFCANKKMKKSTIRRIDEIRIFRKGPELNIQVTADGFLYNMMRILVGTLLEVGQGKRSAQSVGALFGVKREEAGFLAPAQGLCLMEVTY